MKNPKLWFVIGILLTILVVVDFVLWWYLSTFSLSFEKTKTLYLSFSPPFFRNSRYLTGLFLALNTLALYLTGKAITTSARIFIRQVLSSRS
ncbi:hypothetical protein [Persicitalea jodogahamensis]|uniref:hypothetical protein n=1 Tax=Persicitalea jodogahamensis TaxID=402147 RepID=UPI001674D946|nr:hypothetical protein [Persicitalea jodogahamensis]